MGFLGEKSRHGLQHQEVGLLVKRWLAFIDREQKVRGHLEDVSANFASTVPPERTWVKFVENTQHKALRWHSLRRLQAAQLWALGASVQVLQLAGGWRSQQVVYHFAKPQHAWQYERPCRKRFAETSSLRRRSCRANGQPGCDRKLGRRSKSLRLTEPYRVQ